MNFELCRKSEKSIYSQQQSHSPPIFDHSSFLLGECRVISDHPSFLLFLPKREAHLYYYTIPIFSR